MRRAVFGLWMMAVMLWAGGAVAQTQAWVQVEAQPTLAEAEARARAYAAAFADVQGYRLGSRWYGIALGPYSPEEAAAKLAELRRENLIPRDSYITDGTNFREAFWPAGTPEPLSPEAVFPDAVFPETVPPLADVTPLAPDAPVEVTPLAPEAMAEPAPGAEGAEGAAAPQADAAPPAEIPAETPDETVAEARRSEAELPRAAREDVQRALQWQGFYSAAIDGAFGSGTRSAMAAYQGAMGLEPTGVLTSRQRATLIADWQAEIAAYGFETVTEAEAGIEITLPLGLVQFDYYEPPFVHFAAKEADGMRIILISQPGDKDVLYGLYDILQSLSIIPPTGERALGERSFEITGQSENQYAHAFAETRAGLVKGYLLVWSPAQAEQAGRVLGLMQSSFRPVGNRALDPGMVPMTEAARRGLLAGLDLRRPRLTASGFYVDATGHVLTTAEAVAACGRITLDQVTEAELRFADAAKGVALLAPKTPLAPPAFAGFQPETDRIGSEVAVAGYAYGDALPAPVITFGMLDAVQGLNGEPGIKRLGITTLPGDAGGPVLDGTGAVLGMVLPRAADPARVLPQGVEFAAAAAELRALLEAQGLTPGLALPGGALAPEDLSRKALGMTVLVSCWE